MEIIYTKKARDDLFNFSYHSKTNTKKYREKLLDYTEMLLYQPYIGKTIDSLKNYQIKQLLFKNHKILYTISNNKIFILSFVHNSQNINLKKLYNLLNFPKL